MTMLDKSFQDYYPDSMAHCYGCGRLNEYGHQIKSYWDGDESVCHFQPKSYHIAIPGYVYGGLLASLIDCHGTGTAAAAAYRAEESPNGYRTRLSLPDCIVARGLSQAYTSRCGFGNSRKGEGNQRTQNYYRRTDPC